jgi:hypothetical protein
MVGVMGGGGREGVRDSPCLVQKHHVLLGARGGSEAHKPGVAKAA